MSANTTLPAGNDENAVEEFWNDNKDTITSTVISIAICILILIIACPLSACITSTLGKALAKRPKRIDPTLIGFVQSIVLFALRFVIMVIVISRLGIDSTSFVAVAGAAVFAIAFALQGAMANFAAGVMVLMFRHIKVGDWVKVSHNAEGVVKSIELFTSTLEDFDGVVITCPNSSITGNTIYNYTSSGKLRTKWEFGVAYTDNLDKVRDVALKAMENEMTVLKSPPPRLFVKETGDNSVIVVAQYWSTVDHHRDNQKLIPELIKKRFDQAGLNFPFPQREMRILNEPLHMYQAFRPKYPPPPKDEEADDFTVRPIIPPKPQPAEESQANDKTFLGRLVQRTKTMFDRELDAKTKEALEKEKEEQKAREKEQEKGTDDKAVVSSSEAVASEPGSANASLVSIAIISPSSQEDSGRSADAVIEMGLRETEKERPSLLPGTLSTPSQTTLQERKEHTRLLSKPEQSDLLAQSFSSRVSKGDKVL